MLRQTGRDVSFQSFVPQTLPFPPQYILMDVERVFFPWIDGGAARVPDGNREEVRNGEIITEEWHEGRLFRRTFRRTDGRPPGGIVVDYEGGMAAEGTAPAHVTFRNGRYGYTLEIETESHQPL